MLILYKISCVTFWDTVTPQPHSSGKYIFKYHMNPFYQISYDTSNKYLLLLHEIAHVTMSNIFSYFIKYHEQYLIFFYVTWQSSNSATLVWQILSKLLDKTWVWILLFSFRYGKICLCFENWPLFKWLDHSWYFSKYHFIPFIENSISLFTNYLCYLL